MYLTDLSSKPQSNVNQLHASYTYTGLALVYGSTLYMVEGCVCICVRVSRLRVSSV